MRMRPSLFTGRMVLPCLLLACAACSGGLNSVTGKVTHKGEGVKGAVLVLVPTDPRTNPERPSGVTGEDGSFSLTTGNKQGAPAGDYQVTITWNEYVTKKGKPAKLSMQGDDEEIRDRLKGRYADPAKSKLSATIKNGSNTLPPFDLN